MEHYYEKNIVDIKSEYLTYLIDVLVPLIYEGIQSIYNHALEISVKFEEHVRTYPNITNPGIIKIFQSFLKDVPSLSSSAIETEVKRIKEFSRCSEWFDDLVKAVIKSYIVLLTYNSSGKTCKLVNEKYHEKVNVNEFIHKCYMECAIVFYNNPELFWNEHPSDTSQMCKKSAYKYIKQCIIDAIHKMLPIKLILQEYLSNDYIVKQPVSDHHESVHHHSEHHNSSRHHDDSEHLSPVNGFRQISSEENHDDVAHHSSVKKKTANINSQEVRDNLEKMIDDDKRDIVAPLSEEHRSEAIPKINHDIPINPIIEPQMPVENADVNIEQKQNDVVKPINFEQHDNQQIENRALSDRKIDAYFDKFF